MKYLLPLTKWFFLLLAMAALACLAYMSTKQEYGWAIYYLLASVFSLMAGLELQKKHMAMQERIVHPPIPFGFRRISPDGQRWEWWVGSHFVPKNLFVLHLNARSGMERTLKETEEFYAETYKLTDQHPTKPCKHFLAEDSSLGAE